MHAGVDAPVTEGGITMYIIWPFFSFLCCCNKLPYTYKTTWTFGSSHWVQRGFYWAKIKVLTRPSSWETNSIHLMISLLELLACLVHGPPSNSSLWYFSFPLFLVFPLFFFFYRFCSAFEDTSFILFFWTFLLHLCWSSIIFYFLCRSTSSPADIITSLYPLICFMFCFIAEACRIPGLLTRISPHFLDLLASYLSWLQNVEISRTSSVIKKVFIFSLCSVCLPFFT